MRDIPDIMAEVKWFYDRYKIEHICFTDLTLTVHKNWTQEFCEELIKLNLPISWEMSSGTRSEIHTKELLTLLKESGLSIISYSPESGSEEELKRMKKKVNLIKIRETIRLATGLGIRVKTGFIIGLPGQTFKEAFKTIFMGHYLAVLGVDDIPFYPFAPFPGTEDFKKVISEDPNMNQLYQNYHEFNEFLAFNTHTKLGKRKHQGRGLPSWSIPLLTYLPMISCFLISLIRRPRRIIDFIRKLKIGNVDGLFDIALFSLYNWSKIERKKNHEI